MILAAWLLLGGLLLFFSLPWIPRTRVGLLLFILIAPPLYLLGEGFFGWLFSAEHGRAISSRSFSVLRILVALACALVVVAFIVAVQVIFIS